MFKSAQRIILETLIDQSRRRFSDSPHRELRRLVDLGSTVVSGQSQKIFFSLAEELLAREDSPYYELICSAAQHADPQALKQFGVNFGYESLSRGASRIRKLESEREHLIPWALIFETGLESRPLKREHFFSLLTQARQMGIHTFFIRSGPGGLSLQTALILADEFDDCAFILMLEAGRMPADAAAQLARRPNCLACIHPDDSRAAEELFAQLYRQRALFGLWVPYGPDQVPQLLDGGLTTHTELASEMDALLTLFTPEPACTPEQRQQVGSAVVRLRMAPVHATLPVDLHTDIARVDSIISGGSCLTQLWPDGRAAIDHQPLSVSLNGHTLRSLLAAGAPPAVSP